MSNVTIGEKLTDSHTCEALEAEVTIQDNQAFEPIIQAVVKAGDCAEQALQAQKAEAQTFPPVQTMGDHQLTAFCKAAESIQAFMENVKAEMIRRAFEGTQFEGYTLRQGAIVNRWSAPDETIEAVAKQNGYTVTKQTLLTVKAVKDKVGSDVFEAIFAPYVKQSKNADSIVKAKE